MSLRPFHRDDSEDEEEAVVVFPTGTTITLAELNRREQVVLQALAERGPMTADEFVSPAGLYVNSWAPTFTHLKDYGLVERTGQKKVTKHNGIAFVIAITDRGRNAIKEET